jgi:hypothetical protein
MPRTRNTSKDQLKHKATFHPVLPKKQVRDLALPISHVQFGRIGDDLVDLYHVFREHVQGFTVETKEAILVNFIGDEKAYSTWEKFLLDCKEEAIKQHQELPIDITGHQAPDAPQQGEPAEVKQQSEPAEVKQQSEPAEVKQQSEPAEVKQQGEPAEVKQEEAECVYRSTPDCILAQFGLHAIKALTGATEDQIKRLVDVMKPTATIRSFAGACERILPHFYLSPTALVDPMTVFAEDRVQLFDGPYGVFGVKDKQLYLPTVPKPCALSAATVSRFDLLKKQYDGLVMVRYLYKKQPNVVVNGSAKKICNFCKRLMPNLVDGTCAKCKCIYCGRSSRKEICDPCNFSMYLQTAVELDESIRVKCDTLLFAYEADSKAVLIDKRNAELELERQRVEAMAEIVAAAVKNGVSAEVARNVAQTMISADAKKNKPAQVAQVEGDDDEETEELEESEDDTARCKALKKDSKRVNNYRKRKREQMGEEAYKAMVNQKNREYKARKKQEWIEEARRLDAIAGGHP